MLSLALALATLTPPNPANLYREVLATHVKEGRVDYKGLADKDLNKLDAYLAYVADAKVPADRSAAIGLYVDAYNALVLRAVIASGYPRSVLDVKDFFDAKKHKVAGKTLSLNELEKSVLNPFAKDPRTHFVLVCAAVGCPILEGTPYSGSDLDKRFDAATRRYLAGPTGAVASEGLIKLSKIFDWYIGDFGGPEARLAFVKKHLPADAAKRAGATPKVDFIEYDWTLNKK